MADSTLAEYFKEEVPVLALLVRRRRQGDKQEREKYGREIGFSGGMRWVHMLSLSVN